MITDTRHSRFAILHPVAIKDIKLEGGFWKSLLDVNHKATIPTQYELLESTGRLDNFRRAAQQLSKPFQGYAFSDSDVYKWLEAVSWTLVKDPGGDLRSKVDSAISLVSAAQGTDGYLNTYFSLERSGERWTNLQEKHELYCAGHLIQAAIAHYRITGSDNLLGIAVRLADHLYKTFGPSPCEATGGHPVVEMALVELFRTIRETRYLELARLFIDRRGHGFLGGKEYLVDHAPFRDLKRLAGHAVRVLYLCSGATDIVLESGDHQLQQTLERLWSIMVQQQMYVTGGIGSRYDGEAFGESYELPNARAYAETCAAIASMMWSWRMLQMTGNARFADLLEWTLYNAVLSGVSLDGRHYFYVNPLQDAGCFRRHIWFACACCPPNISRTIAMVPGYIYSLSSAGIWVHLYVGSEVSLDLENGQRLRLRQKTSYPWDGKVTFEIIDVFPPHDMSDTSINLEPFSIFLRLPGWLVDRQVNVKINAQPYPHHSLPGSYLELHRSWRKGDAIEIVFPMPVNYLESHPLVLENIGRVAVSRGPLVYCLESADNPDIDLLNIMLDPAKEENIDFEADLLGGVVRFSLLAKISRTIHTWTDELYRPFQIHSIAGVNSSVDVKCIPYFAWANRSPGAMQVWLKILD